jgi:hypothetical protein
MKLGTEDKKKVWALGVLGVVAAYFVYSNLFDSSTSGVAPKPAVVSERQRAAEEATGGALAPAPTAAPSTSQPVTSPRQLGNGGNRSRGDEFHPSLRSKRKEDQIDPLTVDPTLRLDLLAKVQNVKLDGGQRNLFQFGNPEPVARLAGDEPKIVPKKVAMGPPVAPPPPPPPGSVPLPPPPPITMKYYGLATKRIDGKKTAFFLDGEDILLATEGMTVKKRYKIVRINAESVVIEDTDVKRQQTLKISEDAGGTS